MAKLTRRTFIHYCLGISLPGTVIGCASGNEKKPPEGTSTGDPCEDLSGLSETDLQARKGFNYVRESAYPDMRCDNCHSWLKPKEGIPCGACILFQGPVRS